MRFTFDRWQPLSEFLDEIFFDGAVFLELNVLLFQALDIEAYLLNLSPRLIQGLGFRIS